MLRLLRLIPMCEYGFGAGTDARVSAPPNQLGTNASVAEKSEWGADTWKQRRASVTSPCLQAV